MKLRFPAFSYGVLILCAALATVVSPPAFPPTISPAWGQSAQGFMSPPGDLPPPSHGGATYSLDTLFGALKVAPDEASAKAIEERIWAIEDCRHVSGGLERFLLRSGERVVRVAPKLMAGARKSARDFGKSDQLDADAVARAAIRVMRSSPRVSSCPPRSRSWNRPRVGR